MTEVEIINELKDIIDRYLKESLQKTLSLNEQTGGRLSKDNKSRRILPPISKLKSDSLSKYGYKLSKSPLARKRALKRAARSRGTLAVLKRVNLIGNYSKSVPDNYNRLRSDVEYLKEEYAKEKLSSQKRRMKRIQNLQRSKYKSKTKTK
jgi:hypothetical protein